MSKHLKPEPKTKQQPNQLLDDRFFYSPSMTDELGNPAKVIKVKSMLKQHN
jgi:hypothetical protein